MWLNQGSIWNALLRCREMRGALRRELGLAPDVPLVGIVGRLSPIKNHYLFLEVAARIAAVRPDVRFLVVGDGELGSAIRARAHRLKLSNRVIFAGWRSDLAQVYGDLDVLVSCSDNEGMPISLIEAMAAGCPVLATNVGGVPDLIDDHADRTARSEPGSVPTDRRAPASVARRSAGAGARGIGAKPCASQIRHDQVCGGHGWALHAAPERVRVRDFTHRCIQKPAARNANQRASCHGCRKTRTGVSDRSVGTL